jgi:hypothetical protein
MKSIFHGSSPAKLRSLASRKWSAMLVVYCLGVATALPLDVPGLPGGDYRLEANGMFTAAKLPFVFNGLPTNW